MRRADAAPADRWPAPRDRTGAPGWPRRSACPAAARCGPEIEKTSAAPTRRRRPPPPGPGRARRPGPPELRPPSFGGRLFELLLRPHAPRVERQRFGECRAGLRVLILFAQRDAEPQPCLGILRIELECLVEIVHREPRPAAELRRQVVVADAVRGPHRRRLGRQA